MMATILAFAVACGTGFVLSLRASTRRRHRRCPACRQLLLAWTAPERWTCTNCGGEFCEEGHKGLVPKAAWDAGAREPIPPARIVE